MDLQDRNSGITGNSNANNNTQLLRDIEEISRALYLHRTPSKAFSSPIATHTRSKSTGIVRNAGEGQVTNQKKSSPSVWNWKNPLKALSHVGYQKIKCCFSLQVHSIEGLPLTFGETSLCVHWKRKTSILQTQPSKVSLGVATFDESLVHRCSVYVSRGGPPDHRAKYQAKLSLIYACIVGEPEVDLGKNLVDLTRLLPLSLQELEGVKSSGKWTTSFRLTGKAKGASLNVSFWFSVVRSNFMYSDGIDAPRITNPRSFNSSSSDKLWRVERAPCNLNQDSLFSQHSLDPRLCHEVLLSPSSGFSKSISLVYQKLDERNSCEAAETRLENVDEPRSRIYLDFGSTQESKCQKSDDPEFTVIDKGIELSDSLSGSDDNVAGMGIEVIDISEIIKDDDVCLNAEKTCASGGIVQSNHLGITERNDQVVDVIADNANRDNSSCNETLDLWQCADQFMDQPDYLDVISDYKSARLVKGSLSLEDIAESVENDFLCMISEENCGFGSSFDADIQSPRECLLRQFLREAPASSNFIMECSANENQSEFQHARSNETIADDFMDSNLSFLISVAEEERNKDSQLFINKKTGNFLEDLETSFLMHQWGINEEDFQHSPESCSGGFGSPIELAPEMPLPLPPIEEGLGPVIQTQDGGFLRSMSSSLFRNAKSIANLILQVSTTVVLPSTLGSNVKEILQHMASAGVGRFSDYIVKLMPLQDINGKTMQQISQDAVSEMMVFNRHTFGQHEMRPGPDYNIDKDVEEILCGWEHGNLISEVTCDEPGISYSSLEDLILGIMNQIEVLSIEGLKIQTGMTSGKAPSYIFPQSPSYSLIYEVEGAHPGSRGFTQVQQKTKVGCDIDELVDRSMKLDEWLKLDDGLVREDEDCELVQKPLAADQAEITYLPDRSVECRTNKACRERSGNRQTVAIRLQLRDPFRDYEPVGMPMLALIQVRRLFANSTEETRTVVFEVKDESNEALKNDELSEDIHAHLQSRYVVDAVHLAGVEVGCEKEPTWGSRKQLQYGHRWLLTSGIGKYAKHPQFKSTALILSSPWKTSQHQDILWSITSQRPVTQNFRENIEYIRNPDVIFPC